MTLVTEEQAKEMWCPAARVAGRIPLDPPLGDQTVQGSNRIGSNWRAAPPTILASLACIGSRCMAWRWEKDRDPALASIKDWRGFCGMAGGPS